MSSVAGQHGSFVVTKISSILRTADHVGVELQSGSAALMFGLWLTLPWTYGSLGIYEMFDRIAPSWILGPAIFACGAAQLMAVIMGSYERRKKSAFLMISMWIFVWTLFVAVNPRTTATVIYPIFVLGNAWAYLRMSSAERRPPRHDG